MKPTTSTPVLILLLGLPMVVLADSNDFDFFILAQTWPPSFYNAREEGTQPMTPGTPASDFCIHGLWPNKADGSYPKDCHPTASFQYSAVKSIIHEMKKHWPKLNSELSNDQQFWSHEWKKHGTCSESILNQRDYFATAIRLKQDANNNLLSFLKTAGIEPTNGKPYKISSIKQALKKKTGHTPILNCNIDKQGNRQLYEIWRCVTKSNPPNFFNCGDIPAKYLLQEKRRHCGRDDEMIYFPSFKQMTRDSEL